MDKLTNMENALEINEYVAISFRLTDGSIKKFDLSERGAEVE